jgi:hypothetical protein
LRLWLDGLGDEGVGFPSSCVLNDNARVAGRFPHTQEHACDERRCHISAGGGGTE